MPEEKISSIADMRRTEIDPETGIEHELVLCGGFWIRKRAYRSDCAFRPEMCDKIIEVALTGGGRAAMAVACGVTKKTLLTWASKIPAFKEAIEYADTISQMLDEERLMKMANGDLGKEANFKAQELRMMTKYPDDYRRQTGSNISIDVSTTNNTVNLTPAERQRRIMEIVNHAKAIPTLIQKEEEKEDDEEFNPNDR